MIRAISRICTMLLAFLVLGVSAQDKPTGQKLPPPGQVLAPASTPPQNPCAVLSMQAASPRSVRDGARVKFVAKLEGGDSKISPILSWSISSGVLISGQGTPSIDVDSTGASSAKTLTATLLVGGYPPECPYMAEYSIKVIGPARKVHEYGVVSDEQQADWIDRLIAALADDEQAYLISYAGRTSPRGFAAANVRMVKAHVAKSGTPSHRLIAMDGGYREEAVNELWIVPIGAETPRPSPTINARDIVFPKPTPAAKKP